MSKYDQEFNIFPKVNLEKIQPKKASSEEAFVLRKHLSSILFRTNYAENGFNSLWETGSLSNHNRPTPAIPPGNDTEIERQLCGNWNVIMRRLKGNGAEIGI
ncbi:MAG: hypothetical protein IJV27_00405 [Prevotella sp.]|nr:hypothetical protein [Prevotella sp.]